MFKFAKRHAAPLIASLVGLITVGSATAQSTAPATANTQSALNFTQRLEAAQQLAANLGLQPKPVEPHGCGCSSCSGSGGGGNTINFANRP